MAKKPEKLGTTGRVLDRKRTGEAVKPVTVYMPPELHRRFRLHAVAEGRDMSSILVELVEQYLAKHG